MDPDENEHVEIIINHVTGRFGDIPHVELSVIEDCASGIAESLNARRHDHPSDVEVPEFIARYVERRGY